MIFYKKISLFFNKKKLINCKLLAIDIDGVLTDGSLFYNSNGEVTKNFNVKDGLGIKLLQENGIHVVLISGGKSGASSSRANDLKIKYCLTNVKDKSVALKEIQSKLKISNKHTIFVGDDLNDSVVKKDVSLLIGPKDASNAFKRNADLILIKDGGKGAIRELTEYILIAKGKWNKYLTNGWFNLN